MKKSTVLVLFLILVPPVILAQSFPRRSLKGLTEVGVVIADLKPDAQAAGLFPFTGVALQVVVADSNAISDFYTCATLLEPPVRENLQSVIRETVPESPKLQRAARRRALSAHKRASQRRGFNSPPLSIRQSRGQS